MSTGKKFKIFINFFFPFFAASSRAVLVQITPVLGVLVGVVVTLILIAICIVIFVKIKNKVRELFNPFLLIFTAEKCYEYML